MRERITSLMETDWKSKGEALLLERIASGQADVSIAEGSLRSGAERRNADLGDVDRRRTHRHSEEDNDAKRRWTSTEDT